MNGEAMPVLAGRRPTFRKNTADLWSYAKAFKIFKRAAERDPITLDGRSTASSDGAQRGIPAAELQSRTEQMRYAFSQAIAATAAIGSITELLNLAIFHQSCSAGPRPARVGLPDTLVAEKLLLEGVYREVGTGSMTPSRTQGPIRLHLVDRFGIASPSKRDDPCRFWEVGSASGTGLDQRRWSRTPLFSRAGRREHRPHAAVGDSSAQRTRSG